MFIMFMGILRFSHCLLKHIDKKCRNSVPTPGLTRGGGGGWGCVLNFVFLNVLELLKHKYLIITHRKNIQ